PIVRRTIASPFAASNVLAGLVSFCIGLMFVVIVNLFLTNSTRDYESGNLKRLSPFVPGGMLQRRRSYSKIYADLAFQKLALTQSSIAYAKNFAANFNCLAGAARSCCGPHAFCYHSSLVV